MTDALGLLQQITVSLMSFWDWLITPSLNFGFEQPVAPVTIFSIGGFVTILSVHVIRLFIGG